MRTCMVSVYNGLAQQHHFMSRYPGRFIPHNKIRAATDNKKRYIGPQCCLYHCTNLGRSCARYHSTRRRTHLGRGEIGKTHLFSYLRANRTGSLPHAL